MTPEERQNICDNIFTYISKELYGWMDNRIFVTETMEDLGQLYYNHVLDEVENADTELLNAVIRTIKPRNVASTEQKDYYIALCKILYIEKLPSEVWRDVQREYEDIFIHKFGIVMQKYQAKIDRIDAELYQTKIAVDAIKNATPSRSFMRDISTDEQKLYELCLKCNSLRTQKEMLAFVINYATSKLSNFCDMQDAQSIEVAKKQEVLNLSKENAYGADLSFSSYRDYVKVAEDNLDRPYVLFFKVKIYVIIENAQKQYYLSCNTKSNDAAIDEYKNYIQHIPKIDDLHSYKSNNPVRYNTALEQLISDYKLLDELINKLESSVCLRERKSVLLKAVELYKQGEYEIFNNILPVQIEGMFADYLYDTTTFLRFTKMDIYSNAVLKDKIRYLQEIKSDIYPEAVEYFMYYFNNMIRNKIAHGRYKGNLEEQFQDEIFSKELILDMGMLVHMLSRKSETEKMYRFVHGYKKYYERVIHSTEEHQCFGTLFNDMIGKKIITDYDTMERYRPIQVAYWLVNPYYEKIYGQVDDKKDLLELRNEFLSKEFWEYVLGRLNNVIDQGYDYLRINMEFLSVVKGLFKCNITSDVKQVLGKVNAALLKIKTMQQQD
ncbi:hypothetical protein AALC25_20095 [Lachnospiraceae bacterium 29-84]